MCVCVCVCPLLLCASDNRHHGDNEGSWQELSCRHCSEEGAKTWDLANHGEYAACSCQCCWIPRCVTCGTCAIVTLPPPQPSTLHQHTLRFFDCFIFNFFSAALFFRRSGGRTLKDSYDPSGMGADDVVVMFWVWDGAYKEFWNMYYVRLIVHFESSLFFFTSPSPPFTHPFVDGASNIYAGNQGFYRERFVFVCFCWCYYSDL